MTSSEPQHSGIHSGSTNPSFTSSSTYSTISYDSGHLHCIRLKLLSHTTSSSACAVSILTNMHLVWTSHARSVTYMPSDMY